MEFKNSHYADDMSVDVVFQATEESTAKTTYAGVEGIYNISYENNGFCRCYEENGTLVIVVKNNTKVSMTPINGFDTIILLDIHDGKNKIYRGGYSETINGNNDIYYSDIFSARSIGVTQHSTTPVRIIADTEVENISIAQTQHVYYKNFTLSVNAKDTMTGLKKVSYWVTDDESETHCTEGSKDSPKCLYQNTGSFDVEKNLSITVPVDETKNNTRYAGKPYSIGISANGAI